jgi:hypothetical protein
MLNVKRGCQGGDLSATPVPMDKMEKIRKLMYGKTSRSQLGLYRTVIRRWRMHVHTYGICHIVQKT